MEDVEALMTIAQLAIGLAGFSSVVVALNQRTALSEIDKFFFIALISVAFTGVFLAFVPLGIYHLGYVGASLWKISSTIMLAVGIVLFLVLVRATPKLLRTRSHARTGGALLSFAVPIVIWLLQLVNIYSWPIETGAFSYLFGLVLWLFSAGMDFVHMVIIRREE